MNFPITVHLKSELPIYFRHRKMTRRKKLMLYSALDISIYIFFIILALNMRVLWMSIAFVTVFTASLGASLYLMHYYRHSKKEEKQRMISQNPFGTIFMTDGIPLLTQLN